MRLRPVAPVTTRHAGPFGPDSLTVEPRRLGVGQAWVASFAVTGYPREVQPGWLEPLLSHPATVDISLHVGPVAVAEAAGHLRRQLARLESSSRIDANKGRLVDPGVEVAADDAKDLASRMARGESKLFRIGLYVTVRARSEADLEVTTADVRALAASLLVDMRSITYRQLQGWSATLPVGIDTVRMTRTFDTAALAATYPFVSSDLSDPNGVFYGRSTKGSGLVFWDRFAQDNYNATILARSGAGKSYLAKLETLRCLYRGIDVMVIDPEDEYSRLGEAAGGTRVSLGTPGVCLNPFDFATAEESLADRALFIHTFLATLLRAELDSDSRAALDSAIVSVYEDAGINSDPRTHLRAAPTLGDLVARLKTSGDKDGVLLAKRLAPFTTGSFTGLFDRTTTTKPSGHLVVFSLRDVPDEAKAAATLVALDHIWATVSNRNNPKQRMVLVDEAWLLMREPAGAKFLYRLAKAARKYWCGLTVITQDAADLLGSELGQAVVANSATQILMRQSTQSIEAVVKAFGLSNGERALLLSAVPGEAILSAGRTRVSFRAIASEREHSLVTSDPEEVNR